MTLQHSGNAVLRTAWLVVMMILMPRLCVANQVVTFQFYKVVLSNGGTATGTFDYDFTTKKASSIRLTISNVYFDNSANAPTNISTQSITGSYTTINTSDELQFTFAAPLSPTTGAELSTNPANSYLIIDNGSDTVTTVTVVSGSVLPVASLPNTTASLAGTPNANGWFKGTVTVTLTATPGTLPVAATYYTLDGGATTTYQGAFSVSGEATHTLTFWSVDTGNFEETAHTVPVNIDATPPVTTESNYGETVTLTATDAVSGVAATYYTVDGGTTQTYTAPFIAPVGTDTITYWSVDNAGNTETTHTITFTTKDTIAPTAPGSPYLITANTIVWLPSTDNVGIVGYKIEYYHGHSGRDGGFTWTAIAATSATFATIAANYASYPLRVRAYDATGNYSAGASVSHTPPASLPLTGILSLDGISDLSATAIPLDALTVIFRLPGTTIPVATQTVTLVPTGSPSSQAMFTGSMSPGVFDVALKTPKNLQVVVPNVVIAASSNSLPAPLTLPGGDANDDNAVDVADFGILINAYGSGNGSTGYDANADFNDDGAVDVSDFGILVNNYSTNGAP